MVLGRGIMGGAEMLRNLGPGELLIILAILVLLFGASRLGDLGGAIGRAIREFRREVRDREGPSERGEHEAGKRPPPGDEQRPQFRH